MGKVIPMQRDETPRQPRRRGVGPMPDRFTNHDRRLLLEWAKTKGFSLEELAFGVETVRDWWETNQQPRANWPLVIRRALREGWALRGFKQEMKRLGKVTINARTGGWTITRTAITQELIEKRAPRNG